MTDTDNALKPARRNAPWKKGQSGNPKGCATGSRPKFYVALDAIGEAGAMEIVKATVERAKAGDPLGSGSDFAPRVAGTERQPDADQSAATERREGFGSGQRTRRRISRSGDLTPDEGAAMAALLEHHRRTIETTELVQRLKALKRQTSTSGPPDHE
jgi:hypothetical protein